MDDLRKVLFCLKCEQDRTVVLVRNITSSGTSQVFWMCETCEKRAEKKFIKHEIIEGSGYVIDEIRIKEDYSNQTPCIICGEPGEFHHWMPQAFIKEYSLNSKWYRIGDFLCHHHHVDIWHDIVTPGLVPKKE